MNRTSSVFRTYMAALIFLAISLPLSQFTMSIATYIMALLWLTWDWKADELKKHFSENRGFKALWHSIHYLYFQTISGVKKRFTLFYKNKPAFVFSFLFFIYIIWLFNTSDFHYAGREIRVTSPILFFALMFSSLPKISNKQFYTLLYFYLGALFISTLISTFLLIKGNFSDIREISPFIAPIRLGLNIAFGFFILLFISLRKKHISNTTRVLAIVLALWFLIFLYLMEALTSMIIVVIISLGLIIYTAFRSKNNYVKIFTVLSGLAIPLFLWWSVKEQIKEYTTAPKIQWQKLDRYTARGNPYTFDTIHWKVEDGKYVGLYLNIPELKKEWNKRSKLPFSGNDKAGQQLSHTLIRYLTSKNLRKDSAGVAALSNIDIKRVENGIANHNYIDHPGFHSRLMKILVGYENYMKPGNANGSSIMQRWVYYKAALKIILKHFWTGVGTGDVREAFYKEYHQMDSGLHKQFMHLAHNQFLESFVAFGFFGFILFIIALFYPFLATKAYLNYYSAVFYAIMILSMFSDTTIETPDGAFLFAFFSTLLLFGRKNKNLQIFSQP